MKVLRTTILALALVGCAEGGLEGDWEGVGEMPDFGPTYQAEMLLSLQAAQGDVYPGILQYKVVVAAEDFELIYAFDVAVRPVDEGALEVTGPTVHCEASQAGADLTGEQCEGSESLAVEDVGLSFTGPQDDTVTVDGNLHLELKRASSQASLSLDSFTQDPQEVDEACVGVEGLWVRCGMQGNYTLELFEDGTCEVWLDDASMGSTWSCDGGSVEIDGDSFVYDASADALSYESGGPLARTWEACP